MLIDTHCHIHEADYPLELRSVIERAHEAGVDKIICTGSGIESSKMAVKLAGENDELFATVGIHPYYDETDFEALEDLVNMSDKVVAIGETGLDYYKNSASVDQQIKLFERQIDLAIRYDLPLAFHIREAYDDFWSILKNFSSIRGVLHCFSGDEKQVELGLKHGLYFALNGISTFSNLPEAQKRALVSIPTDKIVLETDAPYLTPEPFRGKIRINEPAYIREIAEYNAKLRNMSLDEFSAISSNNAKSLFHL